MRILPEYPSDAAMVSMLSHYMSHSHDFDAVLDLFIHVLSEGKKGELIQFLTLITNFNDGRVIHFVRDIVNLLVGNRVSVSQEMKNTLNLHQQDALVTVFKNADYTPKDSVLWAFEQLVDAPLAYYLRMFMWNYCPNQRLHVAAKLMKEFDESFVFHRSERQLFENYIPCLVGTMIPFVMVARVNRVEFADKSIEAYVYSENFVRKVVTTMSLIFRAYVVPTTMERFTAHCKHNTDRGLFSEELCKNQEYLSTYNYLVTPILSILKNLNVPLVSESNVGLFSTAKPPPTNNISLGAVRANLGGNEIIASVNRLILFMSFFHHIFNYYHSVGSNSNDIIFGINYDLIIRNFFKVSFEVREGAASDYETKHFNNNGNGGGNSTLLSRAQGDASIPTYSTIDGFMHWIDFLLCVILGHRDLIKELGVYLAECRPNHAELFLLMLQTECITYKNLINNQILMRTIEDDETFAAAAFQTTVSRVMLLPCYFFRNNTERFVTLISEILDQLAETNYVDGPAINSVWRMSFEESTWVNFFEPKSGIRQLSTNRYCWVRCSEDLLRYTVSAFVAYLLKIQLETKFYDPHLLIMLLVVSQHFRKYHFLVSFVAYWHFTVFPDIYLRLFSCGVSNHITNVYIHEKLLAIFLTKIQGDFPHKPCGSVYGLEVEATFGLERPSLKDYQQMLTDCCLDVPKQFMKISDEIKLMCDFVRGQRANTIHTLNSTKTRPSQIASNRNVINQHIPPPPLPHPPRGYYPR